LIESNFCCQYDSHDDEMLHLVDNSPGCFHCIIDEDIAEYFEKGSDFKFPKIHLMQHFREQIQRYGLLKQWSTEIGESSHQTQIKVGFNASNK
ncbi:hypothetical protein K440DRAFT_526210, partial [Wilcoxina mikolae CBS 423.85]